MRKKRLETYSICTCVTDGSGEHGRSRCRCEARFGREDKGEAMGRYLEEELTLPEETATVEKICFLTDGTMRMAYRSADYALKIADSKDNGQTWDTPRNLQSEILGLADAEPSVAALSKDGGFLR